MRGKTERGATANPAGNPTRTSASPGTIKKYMIHENVNVSPGKVSGSKSKTPENPPKITTRRQVAEAESLITPVIAEEASMESQQERVLPTKNEMAEMFARLETAIKGEIEAIRGDMGHILQRVEEAETIVEKQGTEIRILKNQMEEMQREQKESEI